MYKPMIGTLGRWTIESLEKSGYIKEDEHRENVDKKEGRMYKDLDGKYRKLPGKGKV